MTAGARGEVVRHDGVELRLGGRDWIVPPLNFRQLKALAPIFARVGAIGARLGEQEIDDIVRLVHAALSRNYPDLAAEDVAELIDLGNAASAVRAVAGVSGLAASGPPRDGDAPPGEAAPGAASIGTS